MTQPLEGPARQPGFLALRPGGHPRTGKRG